MNLIFQGAPVDGQDHQTDELFANAVDSVTVRVESGQVGRTTVYAGIVSQLRTEVGVVAWSIGVASTGDIVITDATTAATAGAAVPEGLRLPRMGLEVTRMFPLPLSCLSSFVQSRVALTSIQPVSLEPQGTATVLSLTVESTRPQGREAIQGGLEFRRDLCRICPNITCVAPSFSAVSVLRGGGKDFCEYPSIPVTFVEAVFLRGDSNADGRVDISDAIRTLTHLFVGAAEPPCLDAADSNDDARLDITDGIVILNYLFRPGTDIPDPGPSACGPDLTPDGFSCLSHPPCA